MKKSLLFLFLSLFCLSYANSDINVSTVDNITKNISTKSPEYSLDLIYAKKIKTLKYKKDSFSVKNIRYISSYIKAINKLIEYEYFVLNIQTKLDELNKKINLLSLGKNATQKLEYIYYGKIVNIYKKKVKDLKENLTSWEKKLYLKLFDISIDTKKVKDAIYRDKNALKTLSKKLEIWKISLEKWEVVKSQKNINYSKKMISALLAQEKNLYRHLANNNLAIFVKDLKSKDRSAFKQEDIVLQYIKFFDDKKLEVYQNLLHFMEKMRFGTTQVLLHKTNSSIKFLIQKIWNILNYPLFDIGEKAISLINFLIFLLFLGLGLFIGKYYRRSILSARRRYDISNSTVTIISNLGYYLILIISLLLSLKSIGLNLGSFTLIAGALSVGIGFGLKNIVSNFISGLILMFEKSIKIGDYIQVSEGVRGIVKDIRMRSLTIRTNDNIDIIVPNQDFIENRVTNWTLNDKSRRFRIPFGVSYGTKVEDIRKCVLNSLKKSKFPHYKIGEKKPDVIFVSLGNSSINFELFVWVNNEFTITPRITTSKLLTIIYNALDEAKITIPFPQQDVYIKEFPILPTQTQKEKPECINKKV